MITDARPAIFRSSPGLKPLYRQPGGRWAMMDLQGVWFGRILGKASEQASLDRDGITEPAGSWECLDSCVLTSSQPDSPLAWIAWSTPPPPISPSEAAARSRSAEGIGWVLAEKGKVWVNRNPACFHAPDWAGPLVLPFWDGFRSEAPLSWIPAPWRKEEVFESKPLASEGSGLLFDRASSLEQLSVLDAAGSWHEEAFRSILGRASFEAALPQDAERVILRRTYDAFHGMQRARVLMNGRMLGWWHQAEEDRHSRWAQDDLILTVPQDLRGQKVEISIEPPAGAPLFSIARMNCWATIPQR